MHKNQFLQEEVYFLDEYKKHFNVVCRKKFISLMNIKKKHFNVVCRKKFISLMNIKKHFNVVFNCYINHFNFRLARQQDVGFIASLCDCPLKGHLSCILCHIRRTLYKTQ